MNNDQILIQNIIQKFDFGIGFLKHLSELSTIPVKELRDVWHGNKKLTKIQLEKLIATKEKGYYAKQNHKRELTTVQRDTN